MRVIPFCVAVLTACSSAGRSAESSATTPARSAAPRLAANPHRVFEIRTYTTYPGRLEALQARFRNHTMGIFARHGMTNIIYMVPQDSARRDNTLIYVIAHESRAQADLNWAAFGNDPEWKRVAAESERDGKIVQRVDRVFATAADYSPIR